MYFVSPSKVWRRQKESRKYLDKIGKIISWTKIDTPSYRFSDQSSVIVLMIELEETKEKIFAELTDYTKELKLKIGQKVISVLRKIGQVGEEEIIVYGVKFKLFE